MNAEMELTLVNPAQRELVARHLHPHGVDGVGRNGHDVGHHHHILLEDMKRIDGHIDDGLSRQLLDDGQGVGMHLEIEALGVMVRRIERDAVNLRLCQRQSVGRLLTAIVTRGEQQKGDKDTNEPTHRHSSDNYGNRTPSGTGGRRRDAGTAARATEDADHHV